MIPGTRIGLYEITALIGAGGMGQVYRARDTRLNRDVAIKILPESFANDPDRLARFEREAKTLAALNHTNIAHIHGLEESSGTIALVMELVEGEDLAERIARGPIPIVEALPIARQIAEALEAAHEQGIIHRDLKPANIKVRADGTVKVLDFGLAKALDGAGKAGGAGQSSPLNSPTITSPAITAAGLILGTAAYMSPEQAKGKPVDRRADIWAFGCVLYEMLTGQRAFQGDDVSDLLVAVLSKTVDLTALPHGTPRSVMWLIQTCLERDPKNRLRDIGDARLTLAMRDDRLASTEKPAFALPRWRQLLPWALAASGLIIALVATAGALTRSSAPLAVSRLAIPLPDDAPFNVHGYPGRALSLSHDGRTIAYTTVDTAPDPRIRVRRLDDIEIRSLVGTEQGRAPFFSPDGEWLAYLHYAERALKKISMRGGPPVTLLRDLVNAGWMLGSWCDDGRLVIDTWNGGLRVMDGDGGNLRVVSQPTDEWHLDPQPLPGGCRVLFYTHRTEGQAIEAVAVDSGSRTRILDNASHGRYLASGHLLFVRDNTLLVAPFDPNQLKVTGAAIPVSVAAVPDWFGVAAPNLQVAVSRGGTLVYAARAQQDDAPATLVAVTLDGKTEDLATSPFPYASLALSPGGEQVAFIGRRVGNAGIETLDVRRKATTAIANLETVDFPAGAVWSPDGKALYYTRYGPFDGEIMRHTPGSGATDAVVARLPGTWLCVWDISPDGRWLVVSRYGRESKMDLLKVDLQSVPGPQAVTALVATSNEEEGGASISPDGEWFAYSLATGADYDVMIEKFPEGGQKTRVANMAEFAPIWSRDGRELYFRTAAQGNDAPVVMAARVTTQPALSVGEPRRLFTGPFLRGRDTGRTMILAPDGRFLMLRRSADSLSGTGRASQLLVVQNWFEELTVRAPAK